MYYIVFALIGLAASALARLLEGKKPSSSRRVSMSVGVLAALAGGQMGRMIGFHGSETKLAGIVLSVVVAAVVLIGFHALARHRASLRNEVH